MRLIDADAILEYIVKLECGKARNQSYRDGLNDGLRDFFPQIINKSPTIEAVPVIYGRWEKEKENTPCSNCGIGGVDYWNYCPICGAKID